MLDGRSVAQYGEIRGQVIVVSVVLGMKKLYYSRSMGPESISIEVQGRSCVEMWRWNL